MFLVGFEVRGSRDSVPRGSPITRVVFVVTIERTDIEDACLAIVFFVVCGIAIPAVSVYQGGFEDSSFFL